MATYTIHGDPMSKQIDGFVNADGKASVTLDSMLLYLENMRGEIYWLNGDQLHNRIKQDLESAKNRVDNVALATTAA
jgi:hypothetical protein